MKIGNKFEMDYLELLLIIAGIIVVVGLLTGGL